MAIMAMPPLSVTALPTMKANLRVCMALAYTTIMGYSPTANSPRPNEGDNNSFGHTSREGRVGEVTPDSFFSPYSPKCLEKLSEKVSERSAK